MIRKVVLSILLLLSLLGYAEKVTINVSGIRSNQGLIQVAVFQNAKQFDDRAPIMKKYYSKSNMSDGSLMISLDLPKGTYGITVLDDEDRSKDMSFKFGIYPTEGVGFSNYYLEGLSSPDFKRFSFELDKNGITVGVRMRYF